MIEYDFLHHVSISVTDLPRARKFYTDLLGFKELERPPIKVPGVWYGFGDGQQLHLIEKPESPTIRPNSNYDSRDGHFSIWVKSYSKTIEFLEQAGIPYDAHPNSINGFTQIYVLDPDNNLIEFDSAYNS